MSMWGWPSTGPGRPILFLSSYESSASGRFQEARGVAGGTPRGLPGLSSNGKLSQDGDLWADGSASSVSQFDSSCIAEGSGRRGDFEFSRFLRISLGSATELEYHLLLSRHRPVDGIEIR